MKISYLTLFPEYFSGFLSTSIPARARAAGLFNPELVNFRNFTNSKHGQVDDTPYGGGAGLVLMCQPLLDALKATRQPNSKVILLSPQGQTFNQKIASELAKEDHLIFICGHYEGFDERIRPHADMQLSLGDFVMTGGEPAAAAMSDAIVRLIPGVIKQDSSEDDSFAQGLLEYPQYTKPACYEGQSVPDVLLSGHHANIARWRREQSLANTFKFRPDLLESVELSKADKAFLKQLEEELRQQKEKQQEEELQKEEEQLQTQQEAADEEAKPEESAPASALEADSSEQ